MSITSIAANGLNQAQTDFENAAKRISTPNASGDSVALSTDAVNLIQSKGAFEANLKSLKVADELDKSAINLVA
jgi:flagellar basal body rod protein FlgG